LLGFSRAREITYGDRTYFRLTGRNSEEGVVVNLFSIVLFLHLAGALALFIAYGIEWTASALFRNANSIEQVRAWLRVFKVSPPLSGNGLGVVLLSGGYLASLTGAMKQGWIPATLLAIFLALAVGFAMILPRMKRIRAALPAGPAANDPLPAPLRAQLSDPVLLTAIRVRFMTAVGIVYLMAAKMPFIPSLVALVIAIALGILLSISTWNRPQIAPTSS
jgi:hypothetical protein